MKKVLILFDIFEVNALKSTNKKDIKKLEEIQEKFASQIGILLGLIEDTSIKEIVSFPNKKSVHDVISFIEGYKKASFKDDLVIVYLLTDDPHWLDNGAPNLVSDLGISVYTKPSNKNLSRFEKFLNAKIFS